MQAGSIRLYLCLSPSSPPHRPLCLSPFSLPVPPPPPLLQVDTAAFAPHRPLCLSELGADFTVFSFYKVRCENHVGVEPPYAAAPGVALLHM